MALRNTMGADTSILGAAAQTNVKVLHLMRHGTTEMNEYLAKHQYGSATFKDPLIYDTKLTLSGRNGARAAAHRVEALKMKPELLVVSPLRRTMQTAQLAWASHKGPVLVEALASERVYLSSDVGRAPAELMREFPEGRFDFSHLPDLWWYNGGSSDHKKVLLEPQELFITRVKKFRLWLLARPESCIAVVSHHGLLRELTGHSFDNCELSSFLLDPAQQGLCTLCDYCKPLQSCVIVETVLNRCMKEVN